MVFLFSSDIKNCANCVGNDDDSHNWIKQKYDCIDAPVQAISNIPSFHRKKVATFTVTLTLHT